MNSYDPNVFVTSYAVGNEHGFACGKWFRLADFDDAEEFYRVAAEYMETEWHDFDPELCFSDYEREGLPDDWFDESGLDSRIWEVISLPDADADILIAYYRYTNEFDLKEAQERFACTAYDWDDYICDWFCDVYGVPEALERFIDWDAVENELSGDFFESDGYYFRNY